MSYNQGRVAMVDHQSEVKQWKSLVTVTRQIIKASVKGWRPFCHGPRTVGPLLKLEAKEHINVLKLSVLKSFRKYFKI